MSAPLSNKQKAYLAGVARRAYNMAAAVARGRGEVLEVGAEDWRHAEVAKACGKLGLRCCSQDDYKLVEGHFLDALQRPGEAFNAFVRGATNKRRVAEWKVVKECERFGFALGYADKICRAQNHGAGLDDVDEKALWRLVYTIRNRGNGRKKAQEAQKEAA